MNRSRGAEWRRHAGVGHPVSASRLAATTLAVLLVSGCASGDEGSEQDPEAMLDEGVGAAADWDGLELRLGLQADDDARAAAEADGLSEREAELLFDSSLLLRGTGETLEDIAFEAIVDIDDTAVAELRVPEQDQLFVRADVPAIVELTDRSDPEATLEQLRFQIGAFGSPEVGQAAIAGDWIDVRGLDALGGLAGGGTADQPGDLDDDAMGSMRDEVGADLRGFLDDDVDVELIETDDVGQRLRATTDGEALGGFVENLLDVAADAPAFPAAPGLGPGALRDELDDAIPADEEFALDVWVDDGELRQVAVDLTEVVPGDEIAGEVLLVAAVSEFTETIEAPDDATVFDLEEAVSSLFAGNVPGGQLGSDAP